MKAWIYGLSFQRRIWLSFVLLITLTVSANGTISYFIASQVIQRNAFRLSEDTVNKTARVLDQRLKSITMSMMSLTISDPFKRMMTDVAAADRSRYYQHLSALQLVFSQIKFNDAFIQSILVATPIGDFYPTTYFRKSENSFFDSGMYRDVDQANRAIWVPLHEDPFFSGREQVVSLVFGTIGEVPSQESGVYIVVNVKGSDLQQLTTGNASATGMHYMFVNDKGQEIFHSDWYAGQGLEHKPSFFDRLRSDDRGYFFYELNGQDYLVNHVGLDVGEEWKLLGMQSKQQLLEDMKGIQRSTLYALLVALLLSFLFSNRLTKLLLRPLYELSNVIKKVENSDLAMRFETKYQDEVAQVGMRFNRMLDEINVLIHNLKHNENEKRKAEIKALTAQMDPHFLYNALNTVYCKSVLGHNDQVNEMILSLSQMFQLGLSSGRDMVTLEDELAHVKQYIAIQQVCYEQLFDCKIRIGDEVRMNTRVLKLIFQPLVENSILHGFGDLNTGGLIDITITGLEGLLIVSVKDNGCGMDTQEVERVMRTAGERKRGYALRNITARLQLYYNGEAKMELHGEAGIGTEVVLYLPISKEEDTDAGGQD
ncbi:sensor histidine kinase [Paenibacillus sp.]|uniref:cache domain-containing sensor histidine kinase n=1 Tax=Paenibacillus sp. TaxID=58172 RepID=UPI002D72D005|nr:sensor histidine kinase [Paenibacillus sp.]HZG56232.1 sensor histidine kinase [Paenibacillus sp.]